MVPRVMSLWTVVRFWSSLLGPGGRARGSARAALALVLALAVAGAACNTADLTPASSAPTTSSGGVGDGDGDGGEDDPDAPPGDPGDPGGPAVPKTRDVSIQVQPSDQGAAVLGAIKGAKKSVHMTMYLLTKSEVIQALIERKQAGKDVKVILNKSFPTNGGDNTGAFNTLQSAGVAVRWAPSAYTFTHSKTIIVDSEKVLIMTMNLTKSSAQTNREYIATNTDPEDVAVVEQLFAADFDNKAVKVESKLVVSPTEANIVEPRAQLAALIGSAKTSLDVETQTLSDRTVVDAIVAAHEAGVAVRVVLSGEATVTPAQAEAITKLKSSGVAVRSLKDPDIHAKVIVVDGETVFVGSQNMTATGLTQNREVGVITDAPGEASKVRQIIDGDFAKAKPL